MLTTGSEDNFELIELVKEDEALLGFITDYLIKRGFNSTVTELYKEKNTDIKLIPKDKVKDLIESVNRIRDNLNRSESVLFEWWRVFWNILKETKQKHEYGSISANGINSKTEKLSTEGKRPFPNDQSIKLVIIEDGATSTSSTRNSNSTMNSNSSKSINITSISTSNTKTGHSFKKLKKKQDPINSTTTTRTKNESINNLDISSLRGIEKSLLLTNLINKDLTKLTEEEGKRIEIALMNNKVSKESWEIYLRLCKEYAKMPQVPKNHKISKIDDNSDFVNCNNSNYLGVIDQVNQPIDSRRLLLLRQSLYQEYLKKQCNGGYQIYTGFGNVLNDDNSSVNVNVSNSSHKSPIFSNINGNGNNANVNNTVNGNDVNNNNDKTNTITSTSPDTSSGALNFFDENIFEPFEIKDELNFNDFMNEYLI